MTQFLNDDEKLITFLRQNRPVPPPPGVQAEKQLMKLIEKQLIPWRPKRRHLVWAIPGACAASLLLVWGSYRWLNPAPEIAADSAELEAFVIDSWNGAMGETSTSSPGDSLETDWLLLVNPEPESQANNP